MQVGPHSAGAFPGPVCYGIGGTEPTLTDANVVLGYLNPDHLVGGAVKLNADKARSVIAERIARPLAISVEEAAHGAYLIAASNMIRAIKAVSSERGRDPREYALVAFGGNGPLFAVAMAEALLMRRVLVPPSAGVFSSFGLLYSEVEYHFTQTRKALLRGARSGGNRREPRRPRRPGPHPFERGRVCRRSHRAEPRRHAALSGPVLRIGGADPGGSD